MRRLFHLLGTLVATVSLARGPSTFAASTAPGPRSSYGLTVLGDSTQTPLYVGQLNSMNLIFDDTDMLSAWTIEFKHGGENGVLGLTHSRRRHIEIFVDNATDNEDLEMTIAHEIAHGLDLECLDDRHHQRWLESREATGDWWTGSGQGDYAVGAGDWAETYAAWQTGGESKSRLSDDDDSHQIILIQRWLTICARR